MRKMAMPAVVVAMAACNGGPMTFEGNFTGTVTETDTCAGFQPNMFETSLLWLVHQDDKIKTLVIDSDDPCSGVSAGFNGQSATLNAFQCKTVAVGGGDNVAPRIDSGSLSLDSNFDLDVNLRGSYIYAPAGGTPINCAYAQGGKLHRFE